MEERRRRLCKRDLSQARRRARTRRRRRRRLDRRECSHHRSRRGLRRLTTLKNGSDLPVDRRHDHGDARGQREGEGRERGGDRRRERGRLPVRAGRGDVGGDGRVVCDRVRGRVPGCGRRERRDPFWLRACDRGRAGGLADWGPGPGGRIDGCGYSCGRATDGRRDCRSILWLRCVRGKGSGWFSVVSYDCACIQVFWYVPCATNMQASASFPVQIINSTDTMVRRFEDGRREWRSRARTAIGEFILAASQQMS